ncbi:MAG TPA: hypothetical protein VGP85_18055 [Pyrinomonadaceae bacterium]|nr:hypothetical protein [Pyrinomonadaceae bacterium]
MNRQVNRILAFGLTFVVATSLSLLFKVARPQLVAPAQPVSHTTPNTSDEIMRVLMPNGVTADDTQLSKFNRNEAINALKDAKRNALGPRAVGISFLLAALHEDYVTNRTRLVNELGECNQLAYPQKRECAYYISSYLMTLVRRGDTSLLPYLFSVADLADGAFSEELGSFYSDTLSEHPPEFLLTLGAYSNESQQYICWLATVEDGSGMSDERFLEVGQLLQKIAVQEKDPRARVAKDCWRVIEHTRSHISS